MENMIIENKATLEKPAFVAGDNITGVINIRSDLQLNLTNVQLTLIGEGKVYYHKTNYRNQKLCEIKISPMPIKEYSTESGKVWRIPFSIKSTDNLSSTIDGNKKGKVHYYLSWEVDSDGGFCFQQQQEVIILANHCLETLPRSHEISGDNMDEEEHDNMVLHLYSPASAYLPGESIQFRAFVHNKGKRSIKKIAIFLIQNVLFYKSRRNMDIKGRNRSFLMSAKEISVQLKEDEEREWTDELQIPDPVAPSATGFHKVHYELVLVAITKGKKSNTRHLFDEVRYHFDMETYQDDHFRDYLPHATCELHIGSHHGNKLSSYMSSGEKPIQAIHDIWKCNPSDQAGAKSKASKPKQSYNNLAAFILTDQD
ncbi:hypothetical protein EB796_000184 [Bugula neritina]|uniref:Arrestin C-terminal-like domain-containing protein n=1 Tax=Bugula neritina TaxID=10212 RepID=A0A7J7KTU4_BUGNE|nr:hypothetical protein EB796_000184 [Bugula neritina]